MAALGGAVAAATAVQVTKLRDAASEPESGLARRVQRKRVILVTGAASGIGLRTVQMFMAKGWFVGAFDINEDALEKALGDSVSLVKGIVDVCDAESCKRAVQTLCSAAPGGAVDVLFNCAGILSIGEFERIPLERQQSIIDINCKGVINMTMACLPALKESRGCIVSMASLSAVAGVPFHATYAASKAFVFSFTEGLRSELVQYGVRVCDVSVDYVSSPMTATQNWSQGTFMAKKNFATTGQVACKVWDAVNQATRFNEHFFVDDATRFAFRMSPLSRALGLSYHTKAVAQSTSAKL
ncbi:Dehydrogenase/reductase SDR family member 7B [Hondaea fermentalgiana]|uniref:Dehydrogenase/reductase SDR family member 7B n=1 Tax=Hondaea fermentalgiana TaxID=2315210 RepID=A0A2R5GJ09_9STRA|nr:Dehydrogenase/reductase SDR family member 7B [Hondaea fermentalgiana]|eukprot:GBG30877.1 Dehydrogenase/reductase SDR family member 7B [Hondaea fermentalgiana]